MRGASRPTALMVGPGINGFMPEQNKRLPYDPEAAKKLLAEAGYPQRLRGDDELPERPLRQRRARSARRWPPNLARIGVKINLAAETKGTYFPKILRRDTSFYMLGWTPTTYDAHNALNALMACPDDKGAGQFNLGAYCNPKLDELTQEDPVGDRQDQAQRDDQGSLRRCTPDDIGHLPLHQQALAWGVSKKVDADAAGRQLHAVQVDQREEVSR